MAAALQGIHGAPASARGHALSPWRVCHRLPSTVSLTVSSAVLRGRTHSHALPPSHGSRRGAWLARSAQRSEESGRKRRKVRNALTEAAGGDGGLGGGGVGNGGGSGGGNGGGGEGSDEGEEDGQDRNHLLLRIFLALNALLEDASAFLSHGLSLIRTLPGILIERLSDCTLTLIAHAAHFLRSLNLPPSPSSLHHHPAWLRLPLLLVPLLALLSPSASASLIPLARLSTSRTYRCLQLSVQDESGHPLPPSADVYDAFAVQPGDVFVRRDVEDAVQHLLSLGWFSHVEVSCRPQRSGWTYLQLTIKDMHYPPATIAKCVNVGVSAQEGAGGGEGGAAARKCLLPESEERELSRWLSRQGPSLSQPLLQQLAARIEEWYAQKGYVLARVRSFVPPGKGGAGAEGGRGGGGEVVCHVVEGDVTRVQVRFVDAGGNTVKGRTSLALLHHVLPRELRPGVVYNARVGREVVRALYRLALFESVQVHLRPDETRGQHGGVVVDVEVRERPMAAATADADWNFAVPPHGWFPRLDSIFPGCRVHVEQHGLGGMNRSLYLDVSTHNIMYPQDDLSLKLEYVHPFLDGLPPLPRNALSHPPTRASSSSPSSATHTSTPPPCTPRNPRSLRAAIFNSRRLSSALAFQGPTAPLALSLDAGPLWVDRTGAKVSLTEELSSQSRSSTSLVFQEVCVRDENAAIVPRVSPFRHPPVDPSATAAAAGGMAPITASSPAPLPAAASDGVANSRGTGSSSSSGGRRRGGFGSVETSVSGQGVDHLLTLQHVVTRDATRRVHGMAVGVRDILQVEQALVPFTALPFFNRYTLACTRFLPLETVFYALFPSPARQRRLQRRPPPPARSAPCTVVLHARHGACMGDLAAVDAFQLGGAHSVRGFEHGELATCRRFLELSGELRVPLRALHVYSFLDWASDLASSTAVPGNPSALFAKPGGGWSCGVGAQMGLMRLEVVRDGLSGRTDVGCYFGDRY
ncbi:hypothetical protein CLOM_g19880 [Closterium sp. NIES-68]|nr:hypothetical protein CLOM_g19880 [Closterium sp. NIES-68]GJP60929.1 hypothetical protein CLOP_g18146 [Closterium sp. NIES-67]